MESAFNGRAISSLALRDASTTRLKIPSRINAFVVPSRQSNRASLQRSRALRIHSTQVTLLVICIPGGPRRRGGRQAILGRGIPFITRGAGRRRRVRVGGYTACLCCAPVEPCGTSDTPRGRGSDRGTPDGQTAALRGVPIQLLVQRQQKKSRNEINVPELVRFTTACRSLSVGLGWPRRRRDCRSRGRQTMLVSGIPCPTRGASRSGWIRGRRVSGNTA